MKYLRSILRAPEGDSPAAGGDAPSPSASEAASALWGSGDAANLPSTTTDASADAPAMKPADAAPKDAATAETKKPAAGEIFEKFGKKPDATKDTKPADATAPEAKKDAAPADSTEHPEDKLTLADTAKPETRSQFADLKRITKEVRTQLGAKDTEIQTLRQQIAELNSKAVDAPEVERLRAEHKAMSDRLSIVDVQEHPEFKQKYVEPKNQLLSGTKALLDENGVTDVDVASLLGKPRAEFSKAVSEIAESLPAFDRESFLADMRSLYKLDGDAKQALTQSGELAKQLSEQSTQKQRAAFEQTWKDIGGMDQFLVQLTVNPDATPEDRASVEAYNQSVKSVKAEAEKIAFGPSDERTVSAVATKAATFDFLVKDAIPRMEQAWQQQNQLIADLQREITALKGHRPNAGGGGGDGGDKGAADLDAGALARQVWKT